MCKLTPPTIFNYFSIWPQRYLVQTSCFPKKPCSCWKLYFQILQQLVIQYQTSRPWGGEGSADPFDAPGYTCWYNRNRCRVLFLSLFFIIFLYQVNILLSFNLYLSIEGHSSTLFPWFFQLHPYMQRFSKQKHFSLASFIIVFMYLRQRTP